MIAARILTVAAVVLILSALFGLSVSDRQGGNSIAVVVSGVFVVSGAVIGLVVNFIYEQRAT